MRRCSWRLFDRHPELVARRHTGDDEADDYVTILLDSMVDHLTGAVFRVSASNVQQDFILHNDSFWDSSWDAVWQSQVSADADGWTVEIRIPFVPAALRAAGPAHLGRQRRAVHPSEQRERRLEMVPKGTDSGVASRMAPSDRPRRDPAAPACGASPLRRHAQRIRRSATGRQPLQRRIEGFLFQRGSTSKWGVTSNSTLNGSSQSGLRSGRGRSCRRESERFRDVLSGKAAVLPGGVADPSTTSARAYRIASGASTRRIQTSSTSAHRPDSTRSRPTQTSSTRPAQPRSSGPRSSPAKRTADGHRRPRGGHRRGDSSHADGPSRWPLRRWSL